MCSYIEDKLLKCEGVEDSQTLEIKTETMSSYNEEKLSNSECDQDSQPHGIKTETVWMENIKQEPDEYHDAYSKRFMLTHNIKEEIDPINYDVSAVKIESEDTCELSSQMKESETSSYKCRVTKFSLKEKCDILKRMDNGECTAEIARQYRIPKSTISGWKRKRSAIEEGASTSSNINRLTLKPPSLFKYDNELFLWFKEQREKGVIMSGPLIRDKALELNKKYGGNANFVASEGWLHSWKKKYDIHQLRFFGERKVSSDGNAIEEYKAVFQNLIATLDLLKCQIYNCDESAFNYKCLPYTTLDAKSGNLAIAFNNQKEYLTILACSNATGTNKLPIFVIGKSVTPRSLRNVNMEELPVCYRSQIKAQMVSALFQEWFHKQFVPCVRNYATSSGLPPKALLVLDNAPCHASEKELVSGDIKAVFLPPNVTTLLQPMEQGVLQNLKSNYRRKLMRNYVREGKGAIFDQLKKITIREALDWLAESWYMVKPDQIAKSWSALLGDTETENSRELISHNEGHQMLEKALKYVQQQNASDGDLKIFKQWQDYAASCL